MRWLEPQAGTPAQQESVADTLCHLIGETDRHISGTCDSVCGGPFPNRLCGFGLPANIEM